MIRTTTATGKMTVTITYVANTQIVIDTLEAAIHRLWDRGVTDHPEDQLWTDLTNQQKLDLLDGYILRAIQNAAREYHIQDAASTASKTAATEANNLYL